MKNNIFITTLIVSYVTMCYAILTTQIVLFGASELFILLIFALKSQIFYSFSGVIKRLTLKSLLV
jgi:hypothetical protein